MPIKPTKPAPPAALLETVLSYHQRTKHHFRRYAAGPGALDWASQPDPFRQYAGCLQIPLPLLASRSGLDYGLDYGPDYDALYRPGTVPPQALNLASIGALLELGFGLSAWKQAGATRWPLRCNPSSGNLHPTEAYVVLEDIPEVADGVYHYLSRDHLLEQRCTFTCPKPIATPVRQSPAFLLGLTSIHWREAWKYGERAFRYCQHDVGHAIAAARYAAAVLGWNAQLLPHWSDADIGALLGADRKSDFGGAEDEHPDAMLLISCAPAAGATEIHPDTLTSRAAAATWTGKANALSALHVHDWPVIDEVAQACIKPRTDLNQPAPPAAHSTHAVPALETGADPEVGDGRAPNAVQIIKQRRSAQALDGHTSIPAATFFRMLDRTLPRAGVAPWDALPWQARVHLVLFVHRVDGLAPGLYAFARRSGAASLLREEMATEFVWQAVDGCSAHLSLFLLEAADTRNAARALSCHQEIAADGAFSLGMLAEFDASLADAPWNYRRLFWEAGMLGQVLYLEAEAAGIRGTGIGCYFDDAVHDVLHLQGRALQSMYHFTMGGALEDTRLQTLPPYAHLQRN